MGCDIHATLEYDKWKLKSPNDAHNWYSFAKNIDIDRGYYLFGILAGIRTDNINKIAEPRGVPEDASYEFKQEYEEWDSDAHTASWVTFKELQDWQPSKDATAYYEFSTAADMRDQDFYKTMELLAQRYGAENVRLVFFFDN